LNRKVVAVENKLHIKKYFLQGRLQLAPASNERSALRLTNMSQPDPERPVKKYNPVLFSRRETQEFPSSLKHAGSGASLIHNVHSGAAKRDEDPPEDRPERPRRSFWRRCCALCCGRSSDSDYNDEVLVDTERGSRTDIAHLPPQLPHHEGKKTLVLDLDETLVHSSFKEVDNFDIKLSVEIEDETVEVFVLVRPGTEELLRRLAKHYEIVVYTASLAKYADPLLDQLDKHGVISARLFREHCAFHSGSYVKDLASLGRSLRHTLIVDNSPASYM